MTQKIRIGVLVSGNGSNLQAIIDAAHTEILASAEVGIVISNKKEAFALQRAEKEGIRAIWINPKEFESREKFFDKVIEELNVSNIDLVCLAGFLLKLEPNIIHRFRNRILNIHPALLPKYGGAGMYGHYVHEAVLRAGEKESGCSVHMVDEEFDHGDVLMQRKVPVLPDDTPETLAARILAEEHILYPEAIRFFSDQKIKSSH